MEASTLQAPATLATRNVAVGTPLLRFRSDEQLVALFRAGSDEAFRAIHDRYHKRLLAYARQMLPGRQDAEDALQDVFVRAYSGLRSSDRQLALRAWLFRVAHNRCIDELRRPGPPPPEVLVLLRSPARDPITEVDLRESVRRLVDDIGRLPDQQRSALLMRELGGMSYADLACTLDISIPAVKSLLVRARLSLGRAAEARDTACSQIREELIVAHDRGVRPNATARRHMRDCTGCRCFRRELRGVSHQLAALAPVGPLGVLAQLLGFSGGGAAVGGASAGGGAAVAGAGGTAASAGGIVLGANHVAALLVAAVATAGGAVEIQHTITASAPPSHPRPAHRRADHPSVATGTSASSGQSSVSAIPPVTVAVDPPLTPQTVPHQGSPVGTVKRKSRGTAGWGAGGGATIGPVSGGATAGSTTGTDTASATGSAACTAATTATSPAQATGSTASAPSQTSGSTTASSGPSSAQPTGSTTSPSSATAGCTTTSTGSSTTSTSSTSQSSSSSSTGATPSGTSTGESTGGTSTTGGTTTTASGSGTSTTASTSSTPSTGSGTKS